MRVFKNKWFVRFARQNSISDHELCEAIDCAERGLIDADLGGSVIKQRMARPNEGRSGGYRALICFRVGDRAFFVFGFPKNAADNIRSDELKAFKELAQEYLALGADELARATTTEKFMEIDCDEQNL